MGRVARFEREFARAQATEVVDLPWGYALLQHDFPVSWAHNRLVVTAPVDAETAIATADLVLGGAGCRHRLVTYLDAAEGERAAPAFAAAGYGTHERLVTMVHGGGPVHGDRARVEALTFAELRPSLLADWRADFPDDPEADIEQLADRSLLAGRGAEVAFLGVRTPAGRVVARGELYRRDGVAQFENLITHPAHRGRGHARALLAEALARSAGDDVRFLVAEATGWPRGWYRTLGYLDRVEAHAFQRTPAACPSR
ncbi:hypothetical protein BJP25_04400 [Actinokineospora bangkokensis]|uniref:N-acetyltransferase domain-containing protein n=1 Tax=Actinokineospora bangkokensis TaxID=1193682 RepID=A0A1Q9LEC4_9PSEU|nr:hypothetical protein BJP25_04400 [Actinokineospora bangkokensis]